MNVKMNWGTGLLLVFAGFGGLMAYMTYRCMHTSVDLVAREYYKDELSYQQVIDARKKADALSGEVDLRQTGGAITFTLPREMRNTAVKGSIQFYCPSNAVRDRSVSLQVNEGGRQEIAAGVVLPGHYTVRIQWESGGVRYFEEKPFIVL